MVDIKRSGPGTVPATPLLTAATKQLGEILSEGDALVPQAMNATLTFSLEGADPYAVRDFLQEALKAGKSQEATIEACCLSPLQARYAVSVVGNSSVAVAAAAAAAAAVTSAWQQPLRPAYLAYICHRGLCSFPRPPQIQPPLPRHTPAL